MPTVSVLGVFNADLKFTVQTFPQPGETIHGDSFAIQPGGKGFNQAVAARRAGADVAMLTQLGQDEFANLAFEVMQKEGIDTGHITQSPALPTGAAMILLESASGENQIVIAPGAASLLSLEQTAAYTEAIAASDIFMTNFEVPFEIACEGLKIARRNGIITLLDPAPARLLPREILELVDYITPNETEAEKLTGKSVANVDDAVSAGRFLCAQGAGTALITLGDEGVVAVTGQTTAHTAARSVEPVIDTTGAGDAFNGALAARLAGGSDLQTAINFAIAGATLSVMKNGAAEAMPSKDEITHLLGK